jgi:hypothetical protein
MSKEVSGLSECNEEIDSYALCCPIEYCLRDHSGLPKHMTVQHRAVSRSASVTRIWRVLIVGTSTIQFPPVLRSW